MRAYFAQSKKEDFDSFTKEYPTLAGHAMWNYIYTKYGATNLSNLLYITRINHRLDNGFIYVLGVPFDKVSSECYAHYANAYDKQKSQFTDPDYPEIKIKKKKVSRRKRGIYNIQITDVELSPDGRTLVYVTNELGKYRAWLYDFESEKQTLLMKGSFRNPFQEADYQYPNFSWGQNSNELYGIEEKRDRIFLHFWDFEKQESYIQEFPPKVERVYSIDRFGSDTLLLTASTDGYTDIYLYRTKTREMLRISEDYFDDLDAKTVRLGGSRYIVFASNRTTTSLEKQVLDTLLPEDEYDLYLLSPVTKFVQKLTNSSWASERKPEVHGSIIHYLSDENGIQNRWSLDISGDKLQPQMLTQYKTGIDNFTKGETVGVEALGNSSDPKLRIYSPINESVKQPIYTLLADLKRGEKQPEVKKEEAQSTVPLSERTFYFQSKYEDEIPLPADFDQKEGEDESLLILPDFSDLVRTSADKKGLQKFNPARMLAYRMTFGLTDFDMDLNNEVLFSGLNTFAGFKRGFEYPETGIMMRVESRDLFENYIVSGGARIPLSFNGTEFYLSVEDRKYQLDRKFSIYRKSNKERDDRRFAESPDTRNSIHMGVLELNYPFSIFSSLRLTTTLRFDRTVFLPNERNELNRDNFNQQRMGMRLEYIFDNTYQKRPNILNGTRAKIYIEGMNRFRLQLDPWVFDVSEATMAVIGTDIRHYIRLDRHSILAARFAGATSMGSEKILYYLGGVRNWISPKYNETTPFPSDNNFAFQAAGTDMRGFKQNIRNGSTYLLANTEIRIPFFNYFSGNEIKSKFLRNFQLIGFADAGTAWHGKSPTSEGNPLNTETITNSTSSVTVTYFRDPLVFGYGAGVRLNLLGYFIRLDYAWGFETRKQTDPILYLSLGHDF